MKLSKKVTRKVSVIIGMALLLGGLMLSIKLARRLPPKETAKIVSDTAAPEVRTKIVHLSSIEPTIATTGQAFAKNKVDIYADVNGTLLQGSNLFKVGVIYKKGEIILQLDKKEKQLSIDASKEEFYSLLVGLLSDFQSDYPESFKQWKAYIDHFSLSKPLAPLPKANSEKEKYFLSAKKIFNQFLSIKSSEANLEKYTIKAPFYGIISEGDLNPGTLVRTGQMLGTFIGTGSFEIQLDVPVGQISFIEIGAPLTISSKAFHQSISSKVSRIGKVVDKNTQTFTVYAYVDHNQLLSDGLFVTVILSMQPIENAFTIDRKYITETMQLMEVNDEQLNFTTPKIVAYQGNKIVLIGIPEGTEIVNQLLPGAYEGMPVTTIKK